MSEARVNVNFVSSTDARTVIVKVSGLTRDEQRKLRAVVDSRVRRFAMVLNLKDERHETSTPKYDVGRS